jgi:hypothetical protein
VNVLASAGAERLPLREAPVPAARRPTTETSARAAEPSRIARIRDTEHAEAAFSYGRTAELRGFASRGTLVDVHA